MESKVIAYCLLTEIGITIQAAIFAGVICSYIDACKTSTLSALIFVLINIKCILAICSCFIVCNADSTTQVAAIAAGIEEQVLETLGEKVWRVEGQQNALWIAMDYVDVVVHIFQTELREFYKLEELWADAPATRYEYDE